MYLAVEQSLARLCQLSGDLTGRFAFWNSRPHLAGAFHMSRLHKRDMVDGVIHSSELL